MISGLDAPSLNANAFCPAELREEIFNKFPNYYFAPKNLGDVMRAGKIGEAIQRWLNCIDTQTQVAEYLIQTRPTDFFMTVYTASDWGGHNLWKYQDETHPEYHAASPYRSALLSIYQALDAAIGRLLRYTDDSTQVYVISDHGMGLHSGASYHLAAWLEAQGFMTRAKQAEVRASFVTASRRLAKTILPARLKETIKSSLGDERVKQLQAAEKDSFYSSIDWSRTIAYTEAGRHVININLAGRNKDGIVPPEEYKETCNKLIAALQTWKDSCGVNVVEGVVHRDKVYNGEYTSRASDLYIFWNRAARMGEPPDEVKAKGFWWSGDHRPEGILIARGNGVPSNNEVIWNDTPQVYDLVPTMLHLAGFAVPEGLDGRVLEELSTNYHPVHLTAPIKDSMTSENSLTAEEEKLIEEKLRSLGYL
jgi:predicted AlkP superfamily phosphohydrolase/phosphomutase